MTDNVIQTRVKKSRGQLRRSLALRSVSLVGLAILAQQSAVDAVGGSLVALCNSCAQTVIHVQSGLAASCSAAASQALAHGVIRTMTINTVLRQAFVVALVVSCGWLAFGQSSGTGGGASSAMASLAPVELEEDEFSEPAVFVSTNRESGGAGLAQEQDLPRQQMRTPQEVLQDYLLSPLVHAFSEALQDSDVANRMNKLRRLAIACHMFHDVHKALPPGDFTVSNDGERLLSWRVYLLPYLGDDAKALYDKFHLDEPWDSDNNKPLLSEMPEVFALSDDLAEGMTDVVAPFGEHTMLGSESALAFRSIVDGTANTAMMFEVRSQDAVPWTRPYDFEFDPDDRNAMQRFGNPDVDEFLVAWGDGSVQRIAKTISAEVVAAMIDFQDGGPIRSTVGKDASGDR